MKKRMPTPEQQEEEAKVKRVLKAALLKKESDLTAFEVQLIQLYTNDSDLFIEVMIEVLKEWWE